MHALYTFASASVFRYNSHLMPEKYHRDKKQQEQLQEKLAKKRKLKKKGLIFESSTEQAKPIEALLTDLKEPTIKRSGWMLDPNDAHLFIQFNIVDFSPVNELLLHNEKRKSFAEVKELSREAAISDYLSLEATDKNQKETAKKIAQQRAESGFALLQDVVLSHEDELKNQPEQDVHKLCALMQIYGPGKFKKHVPRYHPQRVLHVVDIVAKAVGKQQNEIDIYSNEQKLQLFTSAIAFAQAFFVSDPKEIEKSKYVIRDQVLLYGINAFRREGQEQLFTYIETQRIAHFVRHQEKTLPQKKARRKNSK